MDQNLLSGERIPGRRRHKDILGGFAVPPESPRAAQLRLITESVAEGKFMRLLLMRDVLQALPAEQRDQAVWDKLTLALQKVRAEG